MAKTIRIDEDTYALLLKAKAELEKKAGRVISLSDAVKAKIEEGARLKADLAREKLYNVKYVERNGN